MYNNNIDDYDQTTLLLTLCRFGEVTPRLLSLLLNSFNDLRSILSADMDQLSELTDLPEAMHSTILEAPNYLDEAEEYRRSLIERKITPVTRFDESYPQLLFELNDPPSILYCNGQLPQTDKKSIAIVGAHEPSNDGIEMTARLTRQFAAADVQIISSLCGGIDFAAHLSAATTGGSSFAIADIGFYHIQREDTALLITDIIRQGGIISEYPPDEDMIENSLHESNRLIAGLSQAIVVTEVRNDSVRTNDLLEFCRDIGKLSFIMIDPEKDALADESSLALMLECGAIPIKGYEQVSDIIDSLV